MKRSEALDIIYQALDEHYDDIVSVKLVDYILTKLEKSGMTPPKVMKIDPGYFPGDAFEYEWNDWEDEDEA
jgi:hypothetical protein